MRARDNPFATGRVERVPFRLPGLTWDELIERLARLNHRAALVGPKGSGKTTLLEQLEPRLRERGFGTIRLRLTEEKRCFTREEWNDFAARLTSSHLVLLDGSEQMNGWRWFKFQRLVRRAAGLLITSHRPARLPTLLECRTTPALLAEIVDELLASEPCLTSGPVGDLFLHHSGNLREALRELYDDWAERELAGGADQNSHLGSTAPVC